MLPAGDRKRGKIRCDRMAEFVVTPPAELVSLKQNDNCYGIETMWRVVNVLLIHPIKFCQQIFTKNIE